MRGAHYLLAGLIAVSAGAAQASGTDHCRNKPAAGGAAAIHARIVCRIEIKVTVSGASCTATAPSHIYVNRNPDAHPVFMFFYIKDVENSSDLKFDAADGVNIIGNGSGGTPPGQVFDRQFQDRRVFLVKNRNPANENFNYEIKVLNGGIPCTSVDPLIHNIL